MNRPSTLGQLRDQGHRQRGVREELRQNLMERLRLGERLFNGIIGYDDTVVPQVVNAILSRHNFILLGLRGQAKTRILRGLAELLDPVTPVIRGCPLNSHPYQPLSKLARQTVADRGDATPIDWLPREDRYREKLATPDITMADLIGDIDPIKAAARRLDLDDEEVIHYGIIPRTNRGVFAINELPDLPTRIQVGLLNILEEKDVQIRGFPLRLPIDVLLVFTANPEDYTNRGSIITPLRDRIESQIHTHYPLTLADGMAITAQESWTARDGVTVRFPSYVQELVEEVAVQARTSSFVDQNSGVSARMTIALTENIISNAERRAMRHDLESTAVRIADIYGAASAVTGKVELVYEGEREGATTVARNLIGKALKAVFDRVLPDPYREDAGGKVFEPVLAWFRQGNRVAVSDASPPDEYLAELAQVPELEAIARGFFPSEDNEARGAAMEFILDGLHQASILSKEVDLRGTRYSDSFDDMVKELRDDR